MSYVTRADVVAEIEPRRLAQLLDDDRDGSEDSGLFASLAAAVDAELDGALSLAYSVPFTTTPAFVRYAACVLMCDLMFRRAGTGDDLNPYKARAADVRGRLAAIADGALPLTPDSASTVGISELEDKVFLTEEDDA